MRQHVWALALLHAAHHGARRLLTGSRVQYRVDDGNRTRSSARPTRIRTAAFTVTRPNTPRVRATTDAGMGPYSTSAKAYMGRRRSVCR